MPVVDDPRDQFYHAQYAEVLANAREKNARARLWNLLVTLVWIYLGVLVLGVFALFVIVAESVN